jgi:hypothetical protein
MPYLSVGHSSHIGLGTNLALVVVPLIHDPRAPNGFSSNRRVPPTLVQPSFREAVITTRSITRSATPSNYLTPQSTTPGGSQRVSHR